VNSRKYLLLFNSILISISVVLSINFLTNYCIFFEARLFFTWIRFIPNTSADLFFLPLLANFSIVFILIYLILNKINKFFILFFLGSIVWFLINLLFLWGLLFADRNFYLMPNESVGRFSEVKFAPFFMQRKINFIECEN
jgi:hypothetical protein